MTNIDAAAMITEMNARNEAEIAQLEAHIADASAVSVLVGQGFVVALPDASLCARVRGREVTSVTFALSACGGCVGASMMTRATAQKVRDIMGDAWIVVHYRDLAARRLAGLLELRLFLAARAA